MSLDMWQGPKPTEEKDPDINVLDILDQHRQRIVFRTKNSGDIVLRYLPFRLSLIIVDHISRYYSHYAEDVQVIAERADLTPEEANDPEILEDSRMRIERSLLKTSQLFALGVIERPEVNTPDDVEAIYSVLDPDEKARLEVLIQELTRVPDPSTIDASLMDIAERYDVQLVDKDMIENMTASQHALLAYRIKQEREALVRRSNRTEARSCPL